MKRIGIGFIALMMLAVASPAVAHESGAKVKKTGAVVSKAKLDLTGQVMGMDLGAGKMSVKVVKGNKTARRMAKSSGGSLSMSVGGFTKFKGAAPDVVGEGSWVRVLASKSGDGLMATKVMVKKVETPKNKDKPKPPAEEYMKLYGTKVGWDPGARVMSLQWSEVNGLAMEWLAAHGSPNPVGIRVTDSTVFYNTGDVVWVKARPSSDGSTLEAIYVK